MNYKSILTGLFISSGTILYSQNVNIPDVNFKTILLNNPAINTNGDNEIQLSEAESYKGIIECSSKNIISLVGIEAFVNLLGLNCYNNNIKNLDLSKNTNLLILQCFQNEIQNLDLSKNKELTYLVCYNNQITILDLYYNTSLEYLNCAKNKIEQITFGLNSSLTAVECSNNNIPLLNLKNNTVLKELTCHDNPLVSLDVTNNLELSYLWVSSTNLTQLDVSKNNKLQYLYCHTNLLSNIDVTNNPLLKNFYCYDNLLKSINVSHNQLLENFYCYGNQIIELDVSENNKLVYMFCQNNSLTKLNVKSGGNHLIQGIGFNTMYNPDLKCIQVDNENYSNNNWSKKDSIASFSTNCNGSLSSTDISKSSNISFYPNPVKSLLHFSDIGNAELYDMQGNLIMFKNQTVYLDMSDIARGVYMMILKDNTNKILSRSKIIKE